MDIVRKRPEDIFLANLKDYASTRMNFSWESEMATLPHLPSGGINIADAAVDAHARDSKRSGQIAIKWLPKAGSSQELTYRELSQRSNAFANALRSLNLDTGDVIFALSPRIPELYIAFFGALKSLCVFSPLFAAFGPEPVQARMAIGRGKALLTTAKLYERKVAPVRNRLPDLQHVIIMGAPPADRATIPGCVMFNELLENQASTFEIPPTHPSDLALLHFTSGTTGLPKGAQHVHEAVASHRFSGRIALDLQPGDVYWCTADPGWVTGTSYGIISPLANGVTLLVDEAEFDAARWYQNIEREKVTVWYTAPTAIRMLMKEGEDFARKFDLSSLRLISSVGEPLNPEVIRWGLRAFQKPIHDNWWQTETGSIMVANLPCTDIALGSMGLPLPGIHTAILQADESGFKEAPLGEQGILAIKSPWPSMFRGYLHQEDRYRKSFTPDGWYLTGDLARKDSEGRYWFIGRADDVIKTAGHLIGPFEVENALMEHPAVAEAGVIGVPDLVAGEAIKAFVTLRPNYSASDDLLKEIRALARTKLGPAVAPRDIQFMDNLPKTRSGKIMRRLLKARELGLPEGDLSTLESDSSPASKAATRLGQAVPGEKTTTANTRRYEVSP
jgi:acetyl-CoA synthetase